MNWQDILIGVANIGFVIALIPLLLSLLGIKTIELGLTLTGLIYGSFLIMATAGLFGLGAFFGGSATFISALMWLAIAAIAFWKNRRQSANQNQSK